MLRAIIFIILFPTIQSSIAQTYNALYRPQYHFSPLSGWIGDPDGLVHYKNNYHLFWWGHAISEDLVFWTEKPWPMNGDDGSFTYYTGSVVVDTDNTSGFGINQNSPMVAIYTMHNKTTGIESQGLSSSNDYETFQYYSGNPVLNLNNKDFRDPDVLWDKQTNRWIMAITLPLERKISFYASNNLLTWEHLSDFGPLGAVNQVWEVPGIVCLPFDGDSTQTKWLLFCGMGPNREQYFTGNFNGTEFIPDQGTMDYLTNGVGLEGIIFENFETTTYTNWAVEGTAFSTGPASGTLANQQKVSGYLGNKLANSFYNGDSSTGKLTSNDFTVTKNCINFLIAGGNHPNYTCINLLVDGQKVRTTTGDNSEQLKWNGWNVSEFKGKTAKIEIVDTYNAGWGHINVDHIMFSDVLMDFKLEHANWIDYGPDFYALRAYRDYDNSMNKLAWMAWMGNWEYANSVPTTWGKGFQSIPREVELKTTPSGIKVFQKPLTELKKLQLDTITFTDKIISGTNTLQEFKPSRNTYEIDVTFELLNDSADFGFNFCVNGTKKMVLGYNSKSSVLYIDRRNSGNVSFNSNFPKIVNAPISPSTNLRLHIFVDRACIEVFVNDGEKVMSSLMFPNTESTGIETFSTNGNVNIKAFKAHRLASIWGIVEGVPEKLKKSQDDFNLYPNPAEFGNTLTIEPNKYLTNQKYTCFIYNGQGKLIDQYESKTSSSFSTTKLRSGIFLVSILLDNGTLISKKLVIK